MASREQVEFLKERIRTLEALVDPTPREVFEQPSWEDHDIHAFTQAVGNTHIAVREDSSAALMLRTEVGGGSRKRRRTLSSHFQETETQQPLQSPLVCSTHSRLTESNLGNIDLNAIAQHPEIIATPSPPAPSDNAAFFGLTSQPHVWSPVEQLTLTGTNESEHAFDDPEIPDIGVDMHSTQLKTHLLRAYFKYQPLWLSVVNKGVFMTHRKKGVQSQWYSNFLESVLLACAARLSTSSAVRALRHEYAKEARADMLPALGYPSAASLQGFLMLSEFEVTQGNDRLGWMLCGQ